MGVDLYSIDTTKIFPFQYKRGNVLIERRGMERSDLWVIAIGCGVFAYIVGSVNLTIAAVRLFHIEGLSDAGSKNPGVTNLFRIAGAKAAMPVLILELAKAFIALMPPRFFHVSEIAPYLVLPFVIGNLFPLFHGFRGGKGVAATVGALLVLNYRVMLLGGVVFILTFVLFRRVSVSSLSMALSYPFLTYAFIGRGPLLFVCVGLCAILFVTHRSNLKRLIEGKEPRLKRTR
jgi:glycerol-3-phosphate acyltransferase PlsY